MQYTTIKNKFYSPLILVFVCFLMGIGQSEKPIELNGEDYWFHTFFETRVEIDEDSEGSFIDGDLFFESKSHLFKVKRTEVETYEAKYNGIKKAVFAYVNLLESVLDEDEEKRILKRLNELVDNNVNTVYGWRKWLDQNGLSGYMYSDLHQSLVKGLSGVDYWYRRGLGEIENTFQLDVYGFVTGRELTQHGKKNFVSKKNDIDNIENKTRGLLKACSTVGDWIKSSLENDEMFLKAIPSHIGMPKYLRLQKKIRAGYFNILKRNTGILFKDIKEFNSWFKKNREFLVYSEEKGTLIQNTKNLGIRKEN